jgi:hypothetical protein
MLDSVGGSPGDLGISNCDVMIMSPFGYTKVSLTIYISLAFRGVAITSTSYPFELQAKRYTKKPYIAIQTTNTKARVK